MVGGERLRAKTPADALPNPAVPLLPCRASRTVPKFAPQKRPRNLTGSGRTVDISLRGRNGSLLDDCRSQPRDYDAVMHNAAKSCVARSKTKCRASAGGR